MSMGTLVCEEGNRWEEITALFQLFHHLRGRECSEIGSVMEVVERGLPDVVDTFEGCFHTKI